MLNKKLKQIRERVNLTQIEMAERLHMSQSAYHNLENGVSKLDRDRIVLIIKEFGTQAADLLEFEGIEIVFKDNATNNGTINGKADIENFYNYSKEGKENISFLQHLIQNLQTEKQTLLNIIEDKKRNDV
jgi:transcriptional regulator with XRE-family HTH domain